MDKIINHCENQWSISYSFHKEHIKHPTMKIFFKIKLKYMQLPVLNKPNEPLNKEFFIFFIYSFRLLLKKLNVSFRKESGNLRSLRNE